MGDKARDKVILKKILADPAARGAERRLLIIRAVIDSLASKGIQGTTYDSVAGFAKMQRSHVAYYYKSHPELIMIAVRYVIASAQETTIELVQKAVTPKERLSAIIVGAFEQARRFPKHAYVLSLLWSLSVQDPGFRLLNTEIRKMGADRIELLLELYLSGTRIKREALSFLAKAVQSIGYGYLLEALSSSTFPSLDEAQDQALRAVFALIDNHR